MYTGFNGELDAFIEQCREVLREVGQALDEIYRDKVGVRHKFGPPIASLPTRVSIQWET